MMAFGVRVRARRQWVAAALLVGLGWLVTPAPVAIYDGVGVPDEPYRYVQAPPGSRPTPLPTSATAKTPVKDGAGTNGLSVATAEQSSQFSLFMPPGAMAAPSGTIEITAVPQVPTDSPKDAKIDGNVYVVALSSASGAVTLTEKASIATLYLRATAPKDGWIVEYRPEANGPWKALQTSRGGTDSFVAAFIGPGQYALAFATAPRSSGTPLLPFLLIGAVVLLVVVVVVVRLRAAPE